MKVLWISIVFVVVTGCSSRSAYQGIQTSNRFECAQLPPAQYEDCIASSEKSFEEYNRERMEALDQ